jgi:hypothetical protein
LALLQNHSTVKDLLSIDGVVVDTGGQLRKKSRAMGFLRGNGDVEMD